jgi:hypothetical protein
MNVLVRATYFGKSFLKEHWPYNAIIWPGSIKISIFDWKFQIQGNGLPLSLNK